MGSLGYFLLFAGGSFVALGLCNILFTMFQRRGMTPTEISNIKREEQQSRDIIIEQRDKTAIIKKYGDTNSEYICPHCQQKGLVRIKNVKRKKGISGAKVMGALVTSGVSLVVTGLSKKDGMTQAHCDNCNCTWDF